MSLTIKLNSINKPKKDNTRKNIYLETKDYLKAKKAANELGKLFTYTQLEDEDGDPIMDGDDPVIEKEHSFIPTRALDELNAALQNFRERNKKDIFNKRKLSIKSDREWKFYPEEIDNEFGVTKYDTSNPIIIKIDESYPLDNTPVKDQLKQLKAEALKELHKYRKMRKEVAFTEKEYKIPGLNLPFKPKYKVYAGGGYGKPNEEGHTNSETHFIHMEAGDFLKLKEASKLRQIFEGKKPLTNDNHVGIEIEFLSKGDKYENAIALAKYKLEKFVTLKDDGSLRPEKDEYKYAHELCVIAPEKLVHEVLRNVINALDEVGCKVNSRCGLHVHLDMRNRDRKLCFNNLVKSQRILYSMNPRQRYDGTTAEGKKDTVYSRKVEVADFDEALAVQNNAGGNARYYGINAMAMQTHNTIEIRLHSGSTNFTKISNWVKILTSIVNANEKFETENHKPEAFCDRYHLNDDMLMYIKTRIDKFKDKQGNHITVEESA